MFMVYGFLLRDPVSTVVFCAYLFVASCSTLVYQLACWNTIMTLLLLLLINCDSWRHLSQQ